jgi:phosphatidylglycerol---prolipoprotein diacylglyceryl transferase
VILHLLFDIAAAGTALAVTALVYQWRLAEAAEKVSEAGLGYAVALVTGAAVGGYGAGSANLWLAGMPGLSRSILGALAGAILAIEIYKSMRGIKGSTGLIFVPAFATSIAVGRWGCFLAGLQDYTYGNPTSLPWGVDYGDGIARHPVPLYESAAMAAWLGFALVCLWRRQRFFFRFGFYLTVLFYALQRFLWEFLKPYPPLLGGLNLFHFICIALACYSVWMMGHPRDERAAS